MVKEGLLANEQAFSAIFRKYGRSKVIPSLPSAIKAYAQVTFYSATAIGGHIFCLLELSTACAFGPAAVEFIPQWFSGEGVKRGLYPVFLCKESFRRWLCWCAVRRSRYQNGRWLIIGVNLALCCVFFQLLNMRIVYLLKLYNLFMQCWQPGTCQGKTELVVVGSPGGRGGVHTWAQR